jgi:thioredoxin-related protein
MRLKLMAIVTALLFATGAMALDETNWSTDLDAAKAQAKKEDKDVLILFAGTDWSEGTIKIAEDILDKKEFLDFAKKSYVLVLVDFPKKQMGAVQSAKNEALAKQYRNGGYPTVLLMEANGDVFACLRGYDPMTIGEYLECLAECSVMKILHDHEMTLANASVGAERAAHLNAALTALGSAGVFTNGSMFGYDKVITEIIALDPKNELHLKSTWECYSLMATLEDNIKAKDWAGAHKSIDDLVAKYPEEKALLQRMYAVKSFVYRNAGDPTKMVEYMQKCADADPTTELGQRAGLAVQQFKAQLQTEGK